jgi:hypothetical protein
MERRSGSESDEKVVVAGDRCDEKILLFTPAAFGTSSRETEIVAATSVVDSTQPARRQSVLWTPPSSPGHLPATSRVDAGVTVATSETEPVRQRRMLPTPPTSLVRQPTTSRVTAVNVVTYADAATQSTSETEPVRRRRMLQTPPTSLVGLPTPLRGEAVSGVTHADADVATRSISRKRLLPTPPSSLRPLATSTGTKSVKRVPPSSVANGRLDRFETKRRHPKIAAQFCPGTSTPGLVGSLRPDGHEVLAHLPAVECPSDDGSDRFGQFETVQQRSTAELAAAVVPG